MTAKDRLKALLADNPHRFDGATVQQLADAIGSSWDAARRYATAFKIAVINRRQQRARVVDERFKEACALIESGVVTRTAIAAKLSLSKNQLHVLVARLQAERSDLFRLLRRAKIGTDESRRILKFVKRLYRRKKFFILKRVAKRFNTSPGVVADIVMRSFTNKERYARFMSRMTERMERRKYCSPPKERDPLWLREQRRRKMFGIDLTGKYWKTYRKLWQEKYEAEG